MTAGPRALPYVAITRHFREVSEDPKDGFARRMLGSFRSVAPTTWGNLLRPDAEEGASPGVVLVAPSGAGKSTEVRSQAERLRQEKHVAFCCEAGAVATDGLRESLDRPSAETFDRWLSGTAAAVLFLDAVDEVYLRQRKFRDVTRRLAKEIDFGMRDIQVVVTVRNGAWSQTDRNDLADLLRPRQPDPGIKVVTFEPIDADALRALAIAAGVEDVEAFLRCFEEDELYNLLDLRPCDAQLFVNYWNKHGAFGSWTQVLADFLETSFIEANPAHQSHQHLSLEQGSGALRRIAAASILTKRTHVTLPTSAPLTAAMDGRRLFSDWEGRLLGELFGNSLFVHKGEAAVQLPQGALTHFLAAKWFGERVRKGWRPEELRDALFVKVFDENRWRVPESRLPVVGWVASEVPELRQLLLDEDPRVLLYEGDPRQLDSSEIVAALRTIAKRAVATKGMPWPTTGTIRQLARPELADAILDLLREYRGNPEVERHLLRYAEIGRYQTCLAHSLEIALDPSADTWSRARALSVVAAIGSASDKAELLTLLSEPHVEVRVELIQALVPDHLRGDALVQFLLRVDNHQLVYVMARVIDRVSLDDVDATLHALLPSLQTTTTAAETKSRCELALVLVLSRLRRLAAMPPWLADGVVALERHWDRHFVSNEERAQLEALFESNAVARRATWEARIRQAHDAEIQTSICRPRVGRLQADDIAWLFEQQKRASTETLKQELLWAIGQFYQSTTEATRQAILARADLPQELATRFEALDAGRQVDEGSRAREVAKRLDDEETRQQNIAALNLKRTTLASGEDLNLLIWGWQHLEHPDTARARIDLGQLRELVGDDLTQCFARGFKACWRQQHVPLPEPGKNSTPVVLLAGLTGLTLEVRDGLDFSALTAAEAELAARYGLLELNAFPHWFDDLRAAHPSAVRGVLEDVLENEWIATCEHHGVMRFASHAPKDVGLLMRSVVLVLAEGRPVGHPKIVRAAANALLVSDDDALRVAQVSRRLVESSAAADMEVQPGWLRVWAHVEPIAAAEWLDNVRMTSADRFNRLVAGAAEQLKHDFDAQTRTALTAIMSPRALEKWVRLLHLAVRPEDDVDHKGVYSPGTRDHAEEFRRRCMNALAEDPSLEAYMAVRRLRDDSELIAYGDLLERVGDAQLARAAEVAAAPWSETDIVTVERGDERRPNSLEDLFRLVLRHLARVGQLVENDDLSYRGLFTEKTSEKEIQRWAASSLKLVGRGLYSVAREVELDEDCKVDIAALADGVGRVPIEIKPLGPYSLNALKACITKQLHGRYMQPADVKYGVLLLVRQTDKAWEVEGRRAGFSALVAAVRAFANAFGAEHDKVITVATIDLLDARARREHDVV